MGHRRTDVMQYSPRQMEAFYALGASRENEGRWLDAASIRLAFHATDQLFSRKMNLFVK